MYYDDDYYYGKGYQPKTVPKKPVPKPYKKKVQVPYPDMPISAPSPTTPALPVPFTCPADLPPVQLSSRSFTQTGCKLVRKDGKVVPDC
jgi:hypothetical protein